jgi:crotonobetainyl-CoA:carnitine CoA-transferase CaiB-like acyl-CoA transferase
MAPSPRILEGVRVVELSHVLAGPHCGRHLADLGAEVVKVESPDGGDYTRHLAAAPGSQNSTYFSNQNAGKLAVAVDIAHPEGQQVVRDLAAAADVVLENFRPGVLRRFGLDWEGLRAVNPRLVMCSISAFGQTGPLASLPGFAYSASAFSGAMHLDIERDGRPHVSHVAAPDLLAAMTAAGAIGFALLHRERTGQGQHVDVSLLDCILAAEDAATPRLLNGEPYPVQRRPGVSVHEAADGAFVVMVTTDEMFARFCAALGRPELARDPRFLTRSLRTEHRAALEALVDGWVAGRSGRAAALEALERHRVPSAPVLTVEEAHRHPHALARGTTETVDDPEHGPRRVFRSAMRFSATPLRPRGPAPARVGLHTREVLARVCKYDEARIAALLAAGAVAQG